MTKTRWLQKIRFYETDGLSLPYERNNSVDFIFSFDSLVHCEAGVLDAYLAECARILRPGGLAFLHHSNLGAHNTVPNAYNHFRGQSTSAARVSARCNDVGLSVLVQEIVSWQGVDSLDCFSLVGKPPISWFQQTVRVTNPEFWEDVKRLRRNLGPYLAGET
jgi:SAM-dependent methyltransferase